jgi:ATP-dependent Clp protease ATP-binding subunit ClpC
MFERFTDQARRVVVIAQDEARRLNHDYIGTEHILLGLLRPETGVPAEILASLGVTPEGARAQVVSAVGMGREQAKGGHIPFTASAKKILERSLAESMRLHHKSIGTEHLLIALARTDTGRATDVLAALGVRPDDLVRQAEQRLAESGYPYGNEPSPARPDVEARLSAVESAIDGILERLAALEKRGAE